MVNVAKLLAVVGALAVASCAEEPPPPLYDTCFMLSGCSRLVFFASGSAAIRPNDEAQLRSFVAAYRHEFPKPGKMYVAIDGHTDTVGDERENLRLSMERARAVRDFLLTEGMPADRLVAMGCGSKGLLLRTSSNVDEAQNRYVTVRGEWERVKERASCTIVE